jgi:hypothetical protein
VIGCSYDETVYSAPLTPTTLKTYITSFIVSELHTYYWRTADNVIRIKNLVCLTDMISSATQQTFFVVVTDTAHCTSVSPTLTPDISADT